MNKRILITGSTGLLGGTLFKAFPGASVTGVSRSGGHDITKYETLETIGEFDILIHCAASFGDDGPDSILINELVNSTGTLNLCKLALERGCRHVIYISTISAHIHKSNEYFNSYAMSKLHGEENATYFCSRNGMKRAILRFSQIYGADRAAEKHQKALYRYIDSVMTGEEIILNGARNPKRNYMYIGDAAEIVRRAAAAGLEGEYDCAHPQSHTVKEVIKLISAAAGKKAKIVTLKDEPPIKSIFIPDDTRIYDEIKYPPAVGLEAGIRKIIERGK